MKHIFILTFLPLFLQGFEIGNGLRSEENVLHFLTKMKNDFDEQISKLQQSHEQLEQDLKEQISKLKQDHEQLEQDLEERVSKLEDLTKIVTLRSCSEYADFGLKKSGSFLIDPDGTLVGNGPFEVFCNFTSGSTEVLHNVGSLTPVDHCHDPGCFQKNVTYISDSTNEEVPATQIAALMQISAHCVQGFYYECTLAPLRADEADFAYWTDRHGEKNVYFTGENKGYHSCDCHFSSEGCFEEEIRANTCNCDANLPAPLVDTGLLTNMSALPVTKLAFGGLTYQIQSASFRLGNLQCYGKSQPEVASSCSALKMKGVTRSGYYEIKKPGYHHITLVFCDMESDGYIDVPQIEQPDDSPLGSISAWVAKPAGDGSQEQFPDGWVLCDGSVIEKGIWAGARTPDLNSGHFLRGGKLGQQLEMEEDQLQDHHHTDPGHTHSASSSSTASSHHHTYDDEHIHGEDGKYPHYCYYRPSDSSYCHSHDLDGHSPVDKNTGSASVSVSTSTSVSSHSTGISGVTSSYRHGAETRPKNMKVSWIMKCW